MTPVQEKTLAPGKRQGPQISVTTTNTPDSNGCRLCGETPENIFIDWRGESFCHDCLRGFQYLPDPEILERTERKLAWEGWVAALRVDPRPPDNGETARLYKRMVALEEAGNVRWDSFEGDWVERPSRLGPDRSWPRSKDQVEPYSTRSLLDHFAKVRKVATGWKAACPAHEDRNPSLSISQGRETWLLRCWAGCSFNEIVRAAGIEPRRLWFR